jgi:shikimate dehydrogenase
VFACDILVERAVARTITFLGVTTAQSAIMRLFPLWRELLGLGDDVALVGRDLPLGAAPERYSAFVAAMRADPTQIGAVITSHKVGVYQAAADLFDELDGKARLCEEISCIASQDGRLSGWATDPLSIGQAHDDLLGAEYFAQRSADALCLGAGGAGLALALHYLSCQVDGAPRHFVLVDRRLEPLERARALHVRLGSHLELECIHSDDPQTNGALVARLAPGSVVINATGMGKDLPGSPLPMSARFPTGGIVWDLNYRGERPFLAQARAQEDELGLRIEDGWRCFLLGWAIPLARILQRQFTPDEQAHLFAAASAFRPG